MTGMPKATASDALGVYDGQDRVGAIVERDRSFFAFGLDEILVGKFEHLHQAMRAIPKLGIATTPDPPSSSASHGVTRIRNRAAQAPARFRRFPARLKQQQR